MDQPPQLSGAQPSLRKVKSRILKAATPKLWFRSARRTSLSGNSWGLQLSQLNSLATRHVDRPESRSKCMSLHATSPEAEPLFPCAQLIRVGFRQRSEEADGSGRLVPASVQRGERRGTKKWSNEVTVLANVKA